MSRCLALLALIPATAAAEPPFAIDESAPTEVDRKLGPCEAVATLADGPTGKTVCTRFATTSRPGLGYVTGVAVRDAAGEHTRYALVIERSDGSLHVSKPLDFEVTSAALKTDTPNRFLPQLHPMVIHGKDAIGLDVTIQWTRRTSDPNYRGRGSSVQWLQHAFLVYTRDTGNRPVVVSTVVGAADAPCRASLDYAGELVFACEDRVTLAPHP
jgi:hypothetical protein